MPHWKNKSLDADTLSRTFSMQKANPWLFFQKDAFNCITRFGDIPCIDRFTRHFNQPLISIGANKNREKLALFPDSPQLQETYQKLREKIINGNHYQERYIINAVKSATANAFPGRAPHEFIHKRINRDKCQEQIISLNAFIILGHGVCRHHALLNAYLLSRLQEDGLISGTIIHHRQNFTSKKTAHTWILFLSNSGTLYSIDSLWGSVKTINTCSDLVELNALYDVADVAKLIEKRLRQFNLITHHTFKHFSSNIESDSILNIEPN